MGRQGICYKASISSQCSVFRGWPLSRTKLATDLRGSCLMSYGFNLQVKKGALSSATRAWEAGCTSTSRFPSRAYL